LFPLDQSDTNALAAVSELELNAEGSTTVVVVTAVDELEVVACFAFVAGWLPPRGRWTYTNPRALTPNTANTAT
jgi:hypothetical protein